MNRWKKVVQVLLGIAIVVALFCLYKPGLFARGNTGDGVMSFFGRGTVDECNVYWEDDEWEDTEGDGEYDEILAMPTCDALMRSIETLQEARNALLNAVVNQDGQTMLTATAAYRKAIQEVQAGFATLKMRVAPDDFPGVSQELLDSYASDYGQPVIPCELGPLEEDIYQ
jgi:hypothetical protein